jgi:hypothetical protein
MKALSATVVLGVLSVGAMAQERSYRTPLEVSADNRPKTLVSNTAITLAHTQHGKVAQIEYLAKSGRAYLKVLGHDASINGRWTLRSVDGVRQICFSYPPKAMRYGADLAFEKGGCEPLASYYARLYDVCHGDHYELGRARSDWQKLELPVGAVASCQGIAFPGYPNSSVLGRPPKPL